MKNSGKLVAVLLLVLLAAFIAFLATPSELYTPFIDDAIIAQAKQSGINIKLNESSTSFIGLKYKHISAFYPRTLSSIEAENIECHLRLNRILYLDLGLHCSATLYEGDTSIDLYFKLTNANKRIAINISKVNLSKHPQIAGLGLRGGTVSAKSENIILTNGACYGSVTASVNDLESPKDNLIPINAKGSFIAIPKFSELDAVFNAMCSGQTLRLELAKLTSSLGKGSGVIDTQIYGSSDTSGKIDVRLSNEAVQRYGALLGLSGDHSSSPKDAFSIVIQGTFPRLTYKIQ